MRLGGYYSAGSINELENLCDDFDCYGLSTFMVSQDILLSNADACIEFGEKARELNMLPGESGMWANLLTDDKHAQQQRIQQVRTMLQNADKMGCPCIVSLVGTKDVSDHALAPHPYMFTDECKKEFREVVLRILDGLDLKTTRFAIEPWCNTFFYKPEDIKEFIDWVDHPSLGLHLDQMNMVNHDNFYNTTDLINTTFDLLADKVVSVHLKDIKWDYNHMFLKWDEVNIGDGVMDYDTYLKKIATLPTDTPCFTEHFVDARDFFISFTRLHHLAKKAGVHFKRR